jgi:parallel beta-helix repeat protein
MKLKSSITMMALLGLLSGSLGLGPFPSQASLAAPAATTRYAKSGGSSGGDCSTWATACELRYALGVAQAGDEIWVAAGIYKPAPGTEVWLNFGLMSDVELYGGFPGNGGGWEQRDPETHVTVLSGDIDNNDITDANGVIVDTANIVGANSYHVVTGNGTTATAVLDGFTITGGNANGPEQYNEHVGGGMFNDSGSPMLASVTFSGNRAARWGGGMYNVNSSPTLTDVTFEENEAAGECGGGMSNFYSSPTLTDVTFSGNTAHVFGGGMHNRESSPALTRVTFNSNTVDLSGGGMFNDRSSPVLTEVTFGGNTAPNVGGGMANLVNSNPTLTDVTFSGNSATNSGGGMFNDNSSPALINTTFSGNTATNFGGGMYNYGGSSPRLINCTLSGNSAASGGGIRNDSSSPPVTNSILWGNTPEQISNSNPPPVPTPIVIYCDIQGSYPGQGNIDADPRFVDPDNENFHLRPDSPCIDAGYNEAVDLVDFDFEGDARIMDGDRDGTATVDMGVDEVHWHPVYLPLILRATP